MATVTRSRNSSEHVSGNAKRVVLSQHSLSNLDLSLQGTPSTFSLLYHVHVSVVASCSLFLRGMFPRALCRRILFGFTIVPTPLNMEEIQSLDPKKVAIFKAKEAYR